MIPDIEPEENPIPWGGRDLGDGYVLLTATDTAKRSIQGCESVALSEYLATKGVELPANQVLSVVRWAWLRLPNGQVARTSWKESQKPLSKSRCARNVIVRPDFSI